MAEFNYIVRVIGKDIDGTKKVDQALQGIPGISQRMGGIIASEFAKEMKLAKSVKLGDLNEVQIKKLEEIVLNPEKHAIPAWAFNRQKDIETGTNRHLTLNELAFALRNDLQLMSETKSYKGLRHMWGLTVRGQKTKSKHRGKGSVVGVSKKDSSKPAAAPAKAAAAAPAKK